MGQRQTWPCTRAPTAWPEAAHGTLATHARGSHRATMGRGNGCTVVEVGEHGVGAALVLHGGTGAAAECEEVLWHIQHESRKRKE